MTRWLCISFAFRSYRAVNSDLYVICNCLQIGKRTEPV